MENEEKKEENGKGKRAILYLLGFLVGFLPFVLVVKMPILGIIFGTVTLLAFGGLITVPEKEVWVIEIFGRFWKVYFPGLRWIFPIPPIMSIRRKIPIWTYPIDLFTENPWIDYKGGGSSQLVQFRLWIEIAGNETAGKRKLLNQAEREKLSEEEIKQIKGKIEKEVLKATYEINDYEIGARELSESLIGGFLNSLTVEAAMGNPKEEKKKRENKDKNKKEEEGKKEEKKEKAERYIRDRDFERALDDYAKEKFDDLRGRLEDWGITFKKFTLTDYKWSEEVERERRKIYEEDRRKIAAEHTAERRRREIGEAAGRATKTLAKKYGYPAEKAQEVIPPILKEIIAADAKSLNRIEWASEGEKCGGANIDSSTIAPLVAAAMTAAEIMKGEKKERKGKDYKDGPFSNLL